MNERLGEFELIRHVATGGMAEIYLAHQTTPKGVASVVVVKRMLPELAVRRDFVQMFLDEGRLTGSLQHPNIVKVLQLGEVPPTEEGGSRSYYIAMELVDGPHLGALFAHSLRKRDPLPLDLCVSIVARVADGLHFAHERRDAHGSSLGLVHRDISPQNILVSRTGDVKVTDFGVAKSSTQQTKTRTGIIKGKVAYMSPEQCLGEAVDRRTDIFALGIVLYELLTRRRLFREKSDLLIMQRITSEDVIPPSRLNPDVDHELDRICQRALEKDRTQRFATSAELAGALDTWLKERRAGDPLALQRWFAEHAAGLAVASGGDEDSALSVPVVASLPEEPTEATPSLQSTRTISSGPLHTQETTVDGLARISSAAPTQREENLPASLLPSLPSQSTIPTPLSLSSQPPGDRPISSVPNDVAAFLRRRRSLLAAAAATATAALLMIFLVAEDGGSEAGIDLVEPHAGSGATPRATTGKADVGRIRVETRPPGATLLIDDDHVGKSPITVDHVAGKARVQAQFFDQSPRAVDIDVKAGETVFVRLNARVPLIVRSNPKNAKVRVDGVLRGETPLEAGAVLVDPEVPLRILIEPPTAAFMPFEGTITARPGEPLVLEYALARAQRSQPPPESAFGSVSVRTAPWTVARVAGERLGETPFADKRVRAGRQQLTLTNPELGIHETISISVPKGSSTVVDVRFEKAGDGWRIASKSVR